MKYFRLRFEDGTFKIVKGNDTLEIIKKYDLASKKHINTYIKELSGEQEAIAISNEDGQTNIFALIGIIYLLVIGIVLVVLF